MSSNLATNPSFDSLSFDDIYKRYYGKVDPLPSSAIRCDEKQISPEIIDKPNLLKNFSIEPMSDELKPVSGVSIISELNLERKPQFLNWFSEFTSFIENSPNDAAIYSKLGMLSSNIHHTYIANLEAFIKQYIKTLIGNKYLLMCLMYKCMIVNIRLISNCDYNAHESLSDKWFDDWIKGEKLNGKTIIDSLEKQANTYAGNNLEVLLSKIYSDSKQKNILLELTYDMSDTPGLRGGVNPFSWLSSKRPVNGVKEPVAPANVNEDVVTNVNKPPITSEITTDENALDSGEEEPVDYDVSNVDDSYGNKSLAQRFTRKMGKMGQRLNATMKTTSRARTYKPINAASDADYVHDKSMLSSVYNQTFRTGEMMREKQYQRLKSIVSAQRTNIMNKSELLKYQYCCNLELAKTAEATKADLWWCRTPSLVAYTVSTTNLAANAMLNQGLPKHAPMDIKTLSHTLASMPMISASTSIAVASIINAALGPIVGLFAGVVVGTISESLWFKDLRSTRLSNLAFQRFIESNENFIEETNKREILVNGNVCSYRNHRKEYLFRFLLSQRINSLYDELCNEYFIKPLKKLDYFLFLYQTNVKLNKTNKPQEQPSNKRLRSFAQNESDNIISSEGYGLRSATATVRNPSSGGFKNKNKNKNKTRKRNLKDGVKKSR